MMTSHELSRGWWAITRVVGTVLCGVALEGFVSRQAQLERGREETRGESRAVQVHKMSVGTALVLYFHLVSSLLCDSTVFVEAQHQGLESVGRMGERAGALSSPVSQAYRAEAMLPEARSPWQ